MSRLIVVRTFFNHFEADVAKSALDAADIESIVQADDAGGVEPGLWPGRGVQLLVREEDAEQARQVLDAPARPV
jgi:hypothetical protein